MSKGRSTQPLPSRTGQGQTGRASREKEDQEGQGRQARTRQHEALIETLAAGVEAVEKLRDVGEEVEVKRERQAE